MLELPALIEPIFRAAGWQGPREHRPEPQVMSAHAIANRILEEFGGLQVGECGPGTETASSNVCFYENIRPNQSIAARPWARQVGRLVAFASASYDHMILFVGEDGRFYVFTDPDEQLYAGPEEFGELMRRLLWGYPYGSALPKDTSCIP